MQTARSVSEPGERPASQGPPTDGRIAARLYAAGALAVVALAYVWIISAGWMTYWPTYTSNYWLLADAFLHGQTSVRVAPDPRLLALSNPYDPLANANLHPVDWSLYRGKYYMYWGPVPAILEMPFVYASRGPFGDQGLAFAFTLGVVIVSAAMLLDIRDRLFPQAPPWTMALAVLVAGLGNPMPFLLAHAAVYEAAITAGQFFLLGGIYCVVRAFALPKPGVKWLALAGMCWGLAEGSRASLALAIGGLVLLVLWRLWKGRANVAGMAAMLLPLAMGAIVLGWYNRVRFGAWSQFGQVYQLGGADLQAIHDHLFALVNAPPAMFGYLLKPLDLIGRPPFVRALGGAWSYPDFIQMPRDYQASEPVAGIVCCMPILVFGLIPLESWVRRTFRLRARAAAKSIAPSTRLEIGWAARCLFVASVLGIAPALFMIGVTMRYLGDCTPPLVILAMIGLWQGLGEWSNARRRLLLQASALALYSIVVGMLLGLSGYYRHFHVHHRGYLGL